MDNYLFYYLSSALKAGSLIETEANDALKLATLRVAMLYNNCLAAYHGRFIWLLFLKFHYLSFALEASAL
jgi:hypothetical protein